MVEIYMIDVVNDAVGEDGIFVVSTADAVAYLTEHCGDTVRVDANGFTYGFTVDIFDNPMMLYAR